MVTKLAPSGVAASLIKGTTIHNFFKLDITGKSSQENGTIDAQILKKTDVIIIDEFAMVDARLFITIEQLCKRYTTKDGRYKAWGGRHVVIQRNCLQYLIQIFSTLSYGLISAYYN